MDVRLAKDGDATIVRAVVRGPMIPTLKRSRPRKPTCRRRWPDGTTPKLRVRFVETVIMTPQGQMTDIGEDEQ